LCFKFQSTPIENYCIVCGISCLSEQQLVSHESGKKHRTNCLKQVSNGITVIGRSSIISLPRQITPTGSNSPTPMKDDNPIHPLFVGGRTCTEVMEANIVRSNSPTEQSEPQGYYCSLCSVHLNSDYQMNEHLLGQRHQKRMRSTTSPFANADPVSVNESLPFINGKSVDYCQVTA
ncbi:uncharacterized protein DEA37_0005771, partial [Paragonimus westermani]